jgi:hypothetical protein
MNEELKINYAEQTKPQLPITKIINNFEVTLDESAMIGKGKYVLCIQDTKPNGKYFEIYLDKNGQPAALPMEWETVSRGEKWQTTSINNVREYIKENFGEFEEIRKLME